MNVIERLIFGLISAGVCVYAVFYPSPKGLPYYITSFAAFVAMTAVYLAAGLGLLKFFPSARKSIRKYPFAFALAAGFFGTLLFALAAVGLLNFPAVFVVFAASAVVFRKELAEALGDLKACFPALKSAVAGPEGIAAAAAAGFIFTYVFITALTPPVYYDTLVYHLGVTERYLSAGRLINMPENVFSYFPQMIQMNYAAYLLMSGELGVKLFQFMFAVMSLSAVYGICRGAGASWKTALILLVSCPLFAMNAARPGAELPLAFFALICAAIFIDDDAAIENAEAGLAGLFAGFALATKYTGGIVAAFFVAVLLLRVVRKRAGLTALSLFVLGCAVPVAPYLLRNLIYAGNPVYPFLANFICANEALAQDAVSYVSHVSSFGTGTGLLEFMVSPLAIVYNRNAFGGDIISPLIPSALLLFILSDRKKTGLMAAFGVFYFITWFFTGQVLRFLLVLAPFAVVIAASAFARSGTLLKYVAVTGLAAAQLTMTFYFSDKYLSPFSVFHKGRDEYIRERASYYDAAQFINRNTDPSKTTLFLGEARTFYCEKPVLAYTVFNRREILAGFDGLDEKNILTGLALRNIGYIMVNREELERLKGSGYSDVYSIVKSPKFNNIMDKYFKKIYSDNSCDIYELKGRI